MKNGFLSSLRVIGLVLAASGAMGASTPELNPSIHYLSSNVGFSHFLDKSNMQSGLLPNPDCLYALTEMVTMQKLPKGYLITVDPTFVDPDGNGVGIAFFYTDKNLTPNQILENYGYYAGKYRYHDLNGNNLLVMAFREYEGNAKSFPLMDCPGLLR